MFQNFVLSNFASFQVAIISKGCNVYYVLKNVKALVI